MTQQVVVSFDFLVEEVVLLGRTPHSTNESSTISATIARKALEVMGLSHLARRSIRTLSGGEAQRVHLARALAQVWQGDPAPGGGNASPYLLLDEPVSALDMQWQHEVMAELAALASQGYAVFAILHDLNLAAQYAHEVAFLKDGQIVAAGHVHQTLTSENVHHVYGVHTTVWQHPVADCPLIVQHSSPRLQSTRRRAASQPLSHPVAHPQPAPEPVHESFIP
jgi:iron complex transport system ATP-binding protein